MVVMKCYYDICFLPLDGAGPKFFGFAEFLVALAVMVLAWTTADVRYRFRLLAAPIPLKMTAFVVVTILGITTLLTDWWRVEQWPVPVGDFITPAGWQALLGFLFLLTFMSWIWFAYIKPPSFSPRNALAFGRTLYGFVLRGERSELAVVADEITRSARALVFYAMNPPDRPDILIKDRSRLVDNRTPITDVANQILLLIGDPRFCRAVVASSPITAHEIFAEVSKSKAYDVQVGIFGRNIFAEALENRDSFVYHETEGYESGLIGYLKPLSKAIFSDWYMVERLDTLFDVPLGRGRELKVFQWDAYSRMLLITFRDYMAKGGGQHSFTMNRALGYISDSVSGLGEINGQSLGVWKSEEYGRLRMAMKVLTDALSEINDKAVPAYVGRRHRIRHTRIDIYDQLANFAFKLICAAARVRSSAELCWAVQHNAVWGELFNFGRHEGPSGRLFKFRLRRLIYEEIAQLRKLPNFVNGPLLGLCLNVTGLTLNKDRNFRDTYPLKRIAIAWTKKYYHWLVVERPRVAAACLVESIAYDEPNSRLIKTYADFGDKAGPHREYLQLDSPPAPPPGAPAAPSP